MALILVKTSVPTRHNPQQYCWVRTPTFQLLLETAVDQNLTGMGNPLAAKQYSITLVMKLHALTNLLPKDLLPKTLFSTYRLPAHPVERPPKHLVEDLVIIITRGLGHPNSLKLT